MRILLIPDALLEAPVSYLLNLTLYEDPQE